MGENPNLMSCRIFVQKKTNSPGVDVAIANDNGGGGFFCICTGGGTAKGGNGNNTGEELHNYIDIIDLLDVCRSIGFVYGMKVQGGKQGGKSKGSSPNLNEPSAYRLPR